MEFGLIKSKIEKKLTESYSNNTFNSEIKKFNNLVLESSDVKKAYYVYDELSKEKGFDKNFAEEYLSECIELFNKIKISKKELSLLENWISNIKCKNKYKDIDSVLNKNTFIIENILSSKKSIVSRLCSKKEIVDNVNIPLDKIFEVANNTLKTYLETLTESELSQIKKYRTLSESELNNRYEVLSEMVLEKLESISEESDGDTKLKIKETIDKIKNEKVDYISFFKLKSLNESL